MRLDGSVSNTIVLWAYVIGFVVVGNLVAAKVNPKPKNYVRRGLPVVAFWNVFSLEKWTPEGVRYHKRALIFAMPAVIAFVLGYVILDLIW